MFALRRQGQGTIGLMALLTCFLIASCDDVTGPGSHGHEIYVEHLERSVDLDGVSWVDARTTNGSIEVDGRAHDPGHIRIRKEVRAPSRREAQRFADVVRIVVEHDGEVVSIYSDYPEPPRHVQVSVSLDIASSRTANIALRSVNGNLQVHGVTAEVHAEAMNGGVTARVDELRGRGFFATTNGRADVRISGGTAPLRVRSVNGSVVVGLHAGFSGRLDAQTVNGRVHAECRVTHSYGPGPHRVVGVLGQGGPTPVVLRTANGNIDLTTGGF